MYSTGHTTPAKPIMETIPHGMSVEGYGRAVTERDEGGAMMSPDLLCERALFENAFSEHTFSEHAFSETPFSEGSSFVNTPSAEMSFERASSGSMSCGGLTAASIMRDDGDEMAVMPDAEGRSIWVVFSGQADVPWLRLLRPSFRHCFVVMKDQERWLTIDPMLHHMDVRMHHHLPSDFDLPGWLAARGQTVVRTLIDVPPCKPAPWRPFTCVEAVKRLLGIHRRLIFTPWQLYRFLTGPSVPVGAAA